VSWASDDRLVTVRLFRKEDTVAGKNNIKMKLKESDHLSQLIEYEEEEWLNACKTMKAAIQWRSPEKYKPYEVNKCQIENSKQAQIQEDYTDTELMVTFLKDINIPSTPKEAFKDNLKFIDDSEITLIPFVENGKEEEESPPPEAEPKSLPDSPVAKRNEGADLDKLRNLVQVLVQNQQQAVANNFPGIPFPFTNVNTSYGNPPRMGMNLPPMGYGSGPYPQNPNDQDWGGNRNDDSGRRGKFSGSRGGFSTKRGPSTPPSGSSPSPSGRNIPPNLKGANKPHKGRTPTPTQRDRNPTR